MSYKSRIIFKSPNGFLIREFRDVGSSRREEIVFKLNTSSTDLQTVLFLGSSMKPKPGQQADFLIVQTVSSNSKHEEILRG